MIIFHPPRSVACEAGLASIICRIVGTQCENVTFSRAMRPSSTSGHVAPGIDLLDAEHRRDVRQPPGVDVEHRRDRHVDVARGEASRAARCANACARRHRVQHELAMAVVDALGQAGRAGRVERRRPRVLGEVRETRTTATRARASTRTRRRIRAWSAGADGPSLISTNLHARPDLGVDRLEQRQELGVDEDHVVGGVIDRVEHLLRRDAARSPCAAPRPSSAPRRSIRDSDGCPSPSSRRSSRARTPSAESAEARRCTRSASVA